MGLDMYLEAEVYVSGWDHSTPAQKARYQTLCDLVGITPVSDSPSFDVNATVGYWRKANAIHRWFVQNVQNGKDECQRSYVSRDELQVLLDLCKQVLATVETVVDKVKDGRTYYPDGTVKQHSHSGVVVAQQQLADRLLPTGAGFFFGSTDYDEYYLDGVRSTVEILERVLNDPALKDRSLYYHASW